MSEQPESVSLFQQTAMVLNVIYDHPGINRKKMAAWLLPSLRPVLGNDWRTWPDSVTSVLNTGALVTTALYLENGKSLEQLIADCIAAGTE